jgi:hypothetical protein
VAELYQKKIEVQKQTIGKLMKTTTKSCSLTASFLISSALLLVTSVAPAQTASENSNLSFFGTLGQLNGGVTYINPNYNGSAAYTDINIQQNACVPTSVANGLIFLNNLYGGNLFQNYNQINNYAFVNDLAASMGTFNIQSNASPFGIVGGTYYNGAGNNQFGVTVPPNEISGLANYISPTGSNSAPRVSIVGGQYTSSLFGSGGIPNSITNLFNATTPTAQFLATALDKSQAVTFWIEWGAYSTNGVWTADGGRHSLTLTSITDNSGSGQMQYWDPAGNGDTNAVWTTANLQTIGGFLYINDFTNIEPFAAEANDDANDLGGDGNYTSGRLIADFVQTAPEPTPFAILAVSAAVGLGMRRFRRGA